MSIPTISFGSCLLTASKSEAAYEFRLAYAQSLPSSSELRQSVAADAIAAALRQPSILDFEPLCKVEAVIAAKDHELFPLLQIFLNNGLAEVQSFADSHAAVLETYREYPLQSWCNPNFDDTTYIELDRSQLEHKVRLLAFSSLAFDYIGRDLPYSQIATTLQIDPSEVEKWSIDGGLFLTDICLASHSGRNVSVIRAGLVSGKLSQTTQSLRVSRSSARKFEREQWEALEKRLLTWKAGLASVIEVIANAQRRGDPGEVVQAVQNEQGSQVEAAA